MNKVARWALLKFVHHHKPSSATPTRFIHSGMVRLQDAKALETNTKLAKQASLMFDEIKERDKASKASFQLAVETYIRKEGLYRRGHVDFIYSALSKMKDFKVASDLEVYKHLLKAFPQEKLQPKGPWQVEFMHFPRQQQCAIDLMEQMEDNGVIPDHEFGVMLRKVFGPDAHAFRKYRRIMYWLPKFKHANPYPVPKELPEDPILLAAMALKRMAIDKENVIDVWKTVEVDSSPLEDTFIVSAQSPTQKELVSQHPVDMPVMVEGGYTVWLRGMSQTYFILRADPKPERFQPEQSEEEEELFNWKTYESENPVDIIPAWSMHEQAEGTVLAMCITGSSTKDSLIMWIRYMQRQNPMLEHIPVVFSLRTPHSEIQMVNGENTQLDRV